MKHIMVSAFFLFLTKMPLYSIEHNERQIALRALRNRQDLFQEEGILNLILDAIDKITVITAQGFMVALAGEEAGLDWDIISGKQQLFSLFELFLRLNVVVKIWRAA